MTVFASPRDINMNSFDTETGKLTRNSFVVLLFIILWLKEDWHHNYNIYNRTVRRVKGKPRNLEVNVCGSLYSTFKRSFYPYAFYNKW